MLFGVEHVEADHGAALADAHAAPGSTAPSRAPTGWRSDAADVAAVGLVPRLVLVDVREVLDEFLHVVLVGATLGSFVGVYSEW